MNNEELNVTTSIDPDGNVTISNDVVATIASIAAKDIDGVAGMVNSFAGGVAELLGKKNMAKGVKVQIEGESVSVDMYVVVEYGVKIPDVAWNIQEKVKGEVEAMTGLTVTAVNVSIEGVNIAKKAEEKEAPAAETEEKTEE